MWFRRTENAKDLEATAALSDAEQQLNKVKAREQEVQVLARESREFRKRNHFADSLQALFEGGVS